MLVKLLKRIDLDEFQSKWEFLEFVKIPSEWT